MSPNLRAVPSSFESTPSGFYAYHTPADFPHQYRLHLRVLPDGNGILIVNATSILHLNETGTFFAWAKMQGGTEEETLERIQKRYKGDAVLIKTDYRNFVSEILNIIRNPDMAPTVTSTGFDSLENDEHLKIPMRANLCLTYRTPLSQEAEAGPELSTGRWKEIIKNAFDSGIPQVLFFGGEPTQREDLIELLAYTEELGLVSGLITSSQRLIDKHDYVMELIEIGLDHLVLEVDPTATNAEDLRHIFDQDLFTCVRFAVTKDSNLLEWALELVRRGANALNLYPASIESAVAATTLHQQLVNHEVSLEHNLPFPLYEPNKQELRLFSPEVDQSDPEYTLTYLPDGSLAETHP